jgi:hypothetical protein
MVKSFLGLAKVFFIEAPCFVFLSLPACALGYAWCWVVGGFLMGEAMFEQSSEHRRNVHAWRSPLPGEGEEGANG